MAAIRELMTRGPKIVAEQASLADVARQMRDADVGSFPVGTSDNVVGWITDRDIAVRAVAEGRDPEQTKASDVMTRNVICCYEDEDETVAAEQMEQHQVRRIMVCNREEKPVGILAQADLALKTDHELTGEVVRQISKP